MCQVNANRIRHVAPLTSTIVYELTLLFLVQGRIIIDWINRHGKYALHMLPLYRLCKLHMPSLMPIT